MRPLISVYMKSKKKIATTESGRVLGRSGGKGQGRGGERRGGRSFAYDLERFKGEEEISKLYFRYEWEATSEMYVPTVKLTL